MMMTTTTTIATLQFIFSLINAEIIPNFHTHIKFDPRLLINQETKRNSILIHPQSIKKKNKPRNRWVSLEFLELIQNEKN